MDDVAIEDVDVTERPSEAGSRAILLVLGLSFSILAATRALGSFSVEIALLFAAASSFGELRRMRGGPTRRGTVRVTTVGLEHDGKIVASRDDLVSGVLDPGEGPHIILTRRSGRRIDVTVPHLRDARTLLDALGLDSASRTAMVPASSLALSTPARKCIWLIACAIPTILFATWFDPLLWLWPFPVLFIIVFTLSAPASVTVGRDAIVVRWLGLKRITPLADIVGVEKLPYAVRLRHRDGQTTEIRTDATVATLAERIESVLAARNEGANALEATLLARADRSAKTWVEALRRLASAEPSFRAAAVVVDRLWPLVENGSVEASARVAAAVALAPTLDDEGRTRVRVAARASASPSMRVALEAALGDDVEAIATALDEIERDRVPRARQS